MPGYEVEGVLSRGGMGVVYKARHLALKRTVALKMVLAAGGAGPGERARFRAEAEAVARLQHPHIVQVYEVGEHQGLPYCALEYVEGGNLKDRLGAGRCLPGRRRAWSRRWPAPCTWRTAATSSTATSSRPTCCSPPTARPRSPTSDWPGSSTRTPARRRRGRCWGRPATWPPSRPAAGPTAPAHPQTSTPWAPSSTSA